MIREILSQVARGGKTMDMMAKDLGLTQENLRQMFMELEHRGYLRKLDQASSCLSKRCSKCPLAVSCSGDVPSVKLYELTDKGKRVLGMLK